MPRPLRIEFENAWYHVMNSGVGRRDIFKTDKQRKIFLNVVGKAVKVFGAEVHAYCLMSNHYHLLVKTPRGNLSQVMRHINGVYTQHFNRDDQSEGPLFKGRYKAILIDGERYLLQVSRYIHLNPLEAKLVKKADKYRWSSYLGYLKSDNTDSWLTVNEILAMVNKKNSREVYRRFVDEGIDDLTENF